MEEFRQTLRDAILRLPCAHYDEISRVVKDALDQLYVQGHVKVREDYRLGGEQLEVRVRQILERMGFSVMRRREGMEDFVVPPPMGFSPERPLVIEVKSGKDAGPTREHLRQLDDWVFELSGEEEVRKGTRVVSNAGQLLSPFFPLPVQASHPTPHKGVFIYNGPLNILFKDRSSRWLGANEEIFANKRFFCIIAFPDLLAHAAKAYEDSEYRRTFWEHVQETAGVFPGAS